MTEGRTAGAQQQVEVVGHEAPGKQARVGTLDAAGEAFEEVLPIAVVLEERAALDTAGDDVVQSVGSIETRSALQCRWSPVAVTGGPAVRPGLQDRREGSAGDEVAASVQTPGTRYVKPRKCSAGSGSIGVQVRASKSSVNGARGSSAL
jgi:hypothetical protein